MTRSGLPAIALLIPLSFNLDPTVDPMDNIMASQSYPYSGVLIQASRALGTSDQVVVFRDGRRVSPRMVGTDVFAGRGEEPGAARVETSAFDEARTRSAARRPDRSPRVGPTRARSRRPETETR